ncbi:MAG: hypothetical protein K2X81_13550, partial [Candidatus Obscuribacterales bacterium]|nr:hypothetical protein [Candidatus Obscuribacterales bacterium]
MVDFDRQPEFESGLGRAPLLANQAIFVCYLLLVGGLSVANAGIKLPMFQINEALQHLFRFDNSNLLLELFTSTDFIHNFTTVSGVEEGSAFCLIFVMLLNVFVLTRVFAVAAKFSIDKVCMGMVCFLASVVYLPLSLQMSGWLERAIEVAKGAAYTMAAVMSDAKMATPIGKIILGDVSSVWLDKTQQSPVTVLDVAASTVALCLIVAFIPLFFMFLRNALFPKTIMRKGKRGLAVGAAGWRWILGENLVNWEDIQLASVTREKGAKIFQLKTKNKVFKVEWEQLLKYFDPVELMSNLRTYSANAVDISCSVIDAPVGSDYTELWLKYFTTATSRDRTGMLQVGEKLHEGRYEVAGELG